MQAYLTKVDAQVEGDTVFPSINWDDWQLVQREEFEASEINEFSHSFEVYERA